MKHLFRRGGALFLALIMLLLSGCVQPDVSTPGTSNVDTTPSSTTTVPSGPVDEYFLPKEDGCNQITFYWNYKGDAATSSFWIWPEGGSGYSYAVYECGFGLKCMVNIPQDVTRIGFIAIHGCSTVGGDTWPGGTKDYDGDRYLDITGDDMAVYLKSGDPNIYYSDDGGNTLTMDLKINIAGITEFNKIQYKLNAAKKISDLSQVKVFDGDRELTVSAVSTMNTSVNHGVVTVAENLDLSKVYTLKIEGYGESVVVPTGIFDSADFIANYTYDGDDLGAVIRADGSTTFKVWAPTASKVVLNLFTAGNEVEAYANLEMTKTGKGVWELNVPETGHGVYYTYSVTTSAGTQEAVDPYAKAAGLNGDRGMVVDLAATDPSQWNLDQVISLDRYTDAMIWEIHVRDFSNKMAGSNYPGKYLAFTERGLKNASGISIGVDYLLNLGITHLHMLPVYDYASVDESNPTFNWGYDPENYNVPEGSYSTDPYHGEVRINEFKQMVQSLHNDGLGVIMDVVYNHTFDANSNFNKIVPYYYYRFNEDGSNSSASGCGNDTASERYMFRKFMVDSVSYWAKEYHLDGFRFDLMGLHDLETMRLIEQAVHAINPNAIIYGEGWTMGSTIDGSLQANQTNIGQIAASEGAAGSVAVFNDAIRDGLKGSVFDAAGKGYINGNYAPNVSKVQFGIQGGYGFGIAWKVKNAAVINYMSAHDNNTLWDKLHLSNPTNTNEELLAMNRLGAAILMISKGTPFWQAGEEMLRSKPNGDGTFNENSYNASDAVNNIDWEALTPESDAYQMMLFYKGLIEMRKAYGIFRSNGDDVTITFDTMSAGGMVVKFEAVNGEKALVLINPAAGTDKYTLEGSWNLVVNAANAGEAFLENMTGEVTLDARGILVFVN